MAGKGEGSTIGIGLGTTYSCVGVLKHDRVEITANDEGNKTTPSYVRFTNTGEVFESLSKYCFLLHVQQQSPDASKYEAQQNMFQTNIIAQLNLNSTHMHQGFEKGP
ncbi:hypothetical protein ACFE04_031317 [Oxalis oulophora]